MSTAPGHVVVRGASKRFDDHQVLRDANAAALRGEIAVLIGKSDRGFDPAQGHGRGRP